MKSLTLLIVTKPHCSGCELMRRTTLNHPEVQMALEAKWDVYSYRAHEDEAGTDFIWYPTMVAYDTMFQVLRREEGFIPPYEFLVFLHLAEAKQLLKQKDYTTCLQLLETTSKTFPLSGFIPECLYYLGVANHLAHNPRETARIWRTLRENYAQTRWAHKVMLQWPEQ
ncbi:hypothetical protein [Sulfobacillus thermosulfidooxidans]|uniref:hypothetical protein n=1 Tax=Sulfobacillus thermosulfidooxidans TaxID=28034 RepID=UPI0006B63F00|nr:hypothetical protein [Sulfobacillus thermosulfidooxidans]